MKNRMMTKSDERAWIRQQLISKAAKTAKSYAAIFKKMNWKWGINKYAHIPSAGEIEEAILGLINDLQAGEGYVDTGRITVFIGDHTGMICLESDGVCFIE